MSSGRVVKMFV